METPLPVYAAADVPRAGGWTQVHLLRGDSSDDRSHSADAVSATPPNATIGPRVQIGRGPASKLATPGPLSRARARSTRVLTWVRAQAAALPSGVLPVCVRHHRSDLHRVCAAASHCQPSQRRVLWGMTAFGGRRAATSVTAPRLSGYVCVDACRRGNKLVQVGRLQRGASSSSLQRMAPSARRLLYYSSGVL